MNKPTFKELYYLCMQKLTNFPYIEQDFDALTNYELLCKVVEELNKMIQNINTQNESIIALYNAFNELKEYIDNYFENLDVQEEINNKLDDLVRDGTIQNILSNQYNDLMTQVNSELDDFSNRLESIASGSPLVANSTSEMTDTTRVYVNTSDGKWYYYNGTTWAIGGTYQSTEIADGYIDFRKLDTELNGLFYKGMTFLNQGNEVTGHYLTINNSNALIINDNAYWAYSNIDISSYIGKIMFYSTVTFGTNYGLIITDSSNDVLWHSNRGVGEDYTNSNGYVVIPENSKYLYLQQNISIKNNNESGDINRICFHEVGIINNLKQIINYNKLSILTPITSINNYYMATSNQSVNNRPYLAYLSGDYSINIYKIHKGLKYKITGSNYQTSASFVITDNNYKITTISSSLYSQNTNFAHEFTSQNDGYIIATNHTTYPTNVSVYDSLSTYEEETVEIEDNSINFRKLDTELNELFYKGITFENLGDDVTGHYLTVNSLNKLIINDSAYWDYSMLDISEYIGKIMYYNTNTFGTNYGLIITDSSNNVLWHSNAGTGGDYTISNGYITIPSNSKYLYSQQNISIKNNNVSGDINRIYFHNVGIVNNLKQIISYNKESILTSIFNITNYYLSKDSQTQNNECYLTYLASDWNVNVYKIYKGLKYKITGNNYQTSASFVITDNNYKITTISSSLYSQNTNFIHEFTANEDGYIVTSGNTANVTKVYVYDSLSTDVETSMSAFKIGFTGDSICYGSGYTGGYAKILNELYGLNYQNIAVAGGHISADRDDVFIISNSIADIDSDVDGLIMEGGINDYSNYVPTGNITNNYTDTINQSELTGALEKLFRDAVSYFPNIPKAFVIVHNVNLSKVKLPNDIHRTEYPNGEIIDFQYFVDTIYKVANKYGIEVIDIGKNAGMNTYNQTIKDNYTMAVNNVHDGLHPNKNGYTKFYVPYIKEWLDKVLK